MAASVWPVPVGSHDVYAAVLTSSASDLLIGKLTTSWCATSCLYLMCLLVALEGK